MDQHVAGRPAHVGRESVIPAQRTGPADDPSRTRAQARSFGTRPVTKQHFDQECSAAHKLWALLTGTQAKTRGQTQPSLATPDQSMDRKTVGAPPPAFPDQWARARLVCDRLCPNRKRIRRRARGMTAEPAVDTGRLCSLIAVGHAFARVQPATRAPWKLICGYRDVRWYPGNAEDRGVGRNPEGHGACWPAAKARGDSNSLSCWSACARSNDWTAGWATKFAPPTNRYHFPPRETAQSPAVVVRSKLP